MTSSRGHRWDRMWCSRSSPAVQKVYARSVQTEIGSFLPLIWLLVSLGWRFETIRRCLRRIWPTESELFREAQRKLALVLVMGKRWETGLADRNASDPAFLTRPCASEHGSCQYVCQYWHCDNKSIESNYRLAREEVAGDKGEQEKQTTKLKRFHGKHINRNVSIAQNWTASN